MRRADMSVVPEKAAHPSFSEALVVWTRIALLSFGGPAGQIAVMHRILVEEKRWVGEQRFLHALNFCMLLPGPEAQQLAIYIGWLLHRTLGGIVAGVLFVLPGAVAIMALSIVYALYGNVDLVSALFFGLKAAVLAIVLQAVMRIGRRALTNSLLAGIAALSFVGIFVFGLPFPLIIVLAAIMGFAGSRSGLPGFGPGGGHGAGGKTVVADAETALGEAMPDHARPNLAWSLRISVVFLALWIGPTIALLFLLKGGSVFIDIALFFSQMAVVTFGGAYAVLAYVAQEAVGGYGWLEPGEMLDGLGMAETTPGPLIMVTQFVGFMAAYRDPAGLSPLLAGTFGGLLTTWVTFAPCFLWIFLGAPYVERLRENRHIGAALNAITAAVVGVVLNLAIWFALHVLFAETIVYDNYGLALTLPVIDSVNLSAGILVAGTLLAVFRFRLGMGKVLVGAALAGVMLQYLGLT
ncbi:MAG: chromate efflux transporter [Alphaproteobacteria bacterium]|nr:chromate efflux transporter [Alphaproteobacteria bacterium]